MIHLQIRDLLYKNLLLRKLNLQEKKKRLLSKEIEELISLGYKVSRLPEQYMQIKREIRDTELNSLLSLSSKYENGTQINYLHNIIWNSLQNIQQVRRQQPIVGQIVPLYNRFYKFKTNTIQSLNGIKLYILGSKDSLSGSDYKLLSALYAAQFGVSNGPMNMPNVVNMGIVGGKQIFKKGTSGYMGQDEFDSIYRNVVGVTADANGDATPMSSLDQNVALNSDGNKVIQKMPKHSHIVDQQAGFAGGSSLDMQPQSWVKYPLGGRVADKIPPAVQHMVYNQLGAQGSGVPIPVRDPGTQDLVLALVIDFI